MAEKVHSWDKKQIERHLMSAVSKTTPNVWDCLDLSVPQECRTDAEEHKRGKTVIRFMKKTRTLAAAACLCLFLGGGLYFYEFKQIVTVVSLDVNPSLELSLNRRDQVIEVTAVNDDGEAVTAHADIEGRNLSEAVDFVITAMTENGYLEKAQPQKSAVLVTVSSKKNEKKAAKLRKNVTADIEYSLAANEVTAVVYEQPAVREEERQEVLQIAEKYQISEGKAAFIQNLALENENVRDEEISQLAQMNMGEISEKIEVESYTLGSQIQVTSVTEETIARVRTVRSASGDEDNDFGGKDKAAVQEAPSQEPEQTAAAESAPIQETMAAETTEVLPELEETEPSETAAPESSAAETTVYSEEAPLPDKDETETIRFEEAETTEAEKNGEIAESEGTTASEEITETSAAAETEAVESLECGENAGIEILESENSKEQDSATGLESSAAAEESWECAEGEECPGETETMEGLDEDPAAGYIEGSETNEIPDQEGGADEKEEQNQETQESQGEDPAQETTEESSIQETEESPIQETEESPSQGAEESREEAPEETENALGEEASQETEGILDDGEYQEETCQEEDCLEIEDEELWESLLDEEWYWDLWQDDEDMDNVKWKSEKVPAEKKYGPGMEEAIWEKQWLDKENQEGQWLYGPGVSSSGEIIGGNTIHTSSSAPKFRLQGKRQWVGSLSQRAKSRWYQEITEALWTKK